MRLSPTLFFLCAAIFALSPDSKAQSCGGVPVQITASSGSICAGQPVTITITGNLLNNVTVSQGGSGNPQTYTLLSGSVSYTLTPSAGTTVSVTNVSTTLFNPCVPATGSILSAAVTVTPIPGLPTVLSATVSYCRGSAAAALSSLATANVAGGTLTFYDAPSGGNIIAAGTVPSTATPGSTTWYVSQKAGVNCEGPRAPVTVTINDLPGISISPAAAVSVCSGTSTTLTAAGAVAYSWSVASGPGPLGNPANGAAMQVSPSATTTYTVMGTGSNGCSASTSKTVTVLPAPGLAIAGSTPPSTCGGSDGQIIFTVSNLALGSYLLSYQQNGNAQSGSLAVSGSNGALTGLPGGSYSSFSVSQNGCSSAPVSGQVVLSSPGAPGLPTVPNAAISFCKGSTAATALSTLVSTNVSNGILTFYDAPTGGNIVAASTVPSTAIPGSTTWYVSQKSGSGCEGPRAPVTVTVNDLPNLSVSPSGGVSVCAGNSTALTASGAASYSWSVASGPGPLGSPANVAAMQVAPSATTTYAVTGTDNNGCSSTASKTVAVLPTPGLTVNSGTAPSSCGGSDGQISFMVSNLAPGSYSISYQQNNIAQTGTLTVTGNNGVLSGLPGGSYTNFSVLQNSCNSAAIAGPVLLTNPASPSAPAAATSTPVVCAGETILLSASGISGASYFWTGPGGYSASGQEASRSSAVAANSGTYTVIASLNGCPSLPAQVTVLVKPAPGISPVSPQTICSGDQFQAIEFAGTDQTEFDFRNPDALSMSIGLAASGSGLQHIGAFIGTNTGSTPMSNAVWVKAISTSGNRRCEGDSTSFTLTVNPGPAAPSVSTSAPANPCQGLLYQNFSTPPNAGVSYLWTTSGGAQVYAGATSPNALIGFPQAGPASVKLTVTSGGSGCPGIKVWMTEVQPGAGLQTPQIVLVNERLVCLLNTVNGYQWGYDDAQRSPHTLSGETGQDYLPAGGLNGTYNYWVLTYQGGNGCFQKTYYNTPAAVAGLQKAAERVQLSPNPAGSFVNLQFPKSFAGTVKLVVIDMAGHLVMEECRSGVSAQLDVSSLAPGSYFLRCNSNGQQDLIRFTKQ